MELAYGTGGPEIDSWVSSCVGAFENLRIVTISFVMSVCKGGRVQILLGTTLKDQNSIQEEIKSKLT